MYGHERSLVESFSGRPFVLLGVNTDKKKSRVKKAVADNNLNWRSWMDGSTRGPICKDFEVRSFPTIMLIDHEGVIRYHTGHNDHRGIRRSSVLDAVIEEMVSVAEANGMRGGSEPGQQVREFVDITGKHRIEAIYSDFVDGKVVLLKNDEKEVKVPWTRLSYEDRKFVAGARIKKSGIKAKKKDFEFRELNEYSDTSGNKVTGTFIALNDGKAIVWKTDGNQVELSYRKLTDETKAQIRSELRSLN